MVKKQRALVIGLILIFSLVLFFLFLPFQDKLTASAQDFIQPTAFSHKSHAETNQIPCEFCHIYARRSINSGIPTMENCMGCHKVIKGKEEKQQVEIQKLIDYWESKKPIPWKKIHDVPDFVHFSHKRHIQIGYDCTECHGEIFNLDQISMDNMKTDLSMGWCVTCHNIKQPTVNGKIIAQQRRTRGSSILETAVAGQPDGALLVSSDCYICHK